MEETGTRVSKALNKRVLLLRIPWQWCMGLLVVSMLAFNYMSKLAGFLIFLIVWAVARFLYKKEPEFLKVIRLRWWSGYRKAFDAAKGEHV